MAIIPFVGREREQVILQKALKSIEAEMISVIGRRRVGKTFLVKSVYRNRIAFEMTGIKNASRSEQLRNFANRLQAVAPSSLIIKPPSDWLEAFFMLVDFLKQKDQTEKLVVFFDELPWLATHKSGFLKGLSFFWNSWAVEQNIVVVICGSAASWMINKIIRNKGGLHNRVTKRIDLKAFNLAETEQYLESRDVYFEPFQILQLYMTMGGIPHYLKEIEAGKSAIQNIDQICFEEGGLLRNEFSSLYDALFENSGYHIAVIKALAGKRMGMTRKEIVHTAKISVGSKTSRVLEELTQSGFISVYYAFGKKKKGKLYRLTDEYSLFYLQFIENKILQGENIWQMLSQTQAYKTWSGYAFESICLKHIPQIKKALGIAGVYSLATTFSKRGTEQEEGTQIDLVIDRNDHVINLFEIKFYNTEFTLTKSYSKKLRDKMRIFQETTKTRKQLFITLISTFGLKHNKYSLGLVSNSMDMEVLFEK